MSPHTLLLVRWMLVFVLLCSGLASLPTTMASERPALTSQAPTMPSGLTPTDWAAIQAHLAASTPHTPEAIPAGQQTYLKAPQTGETDYFGWSVAVSGNTLVVGAPYEDGDTAATLAAPNNNAMDAGAAYVFVRSGGTWSLQAYLKAPNAEAGDWFGWSVAIAGDTIAVAARNESGDAASTLAAPNNNASDAGAVYVFVRSGTTWSLQTYLKAPNAETFDIFGASVAISGDTLVVGATGEDGDFSSALGALNNNADAAGAVYVFVRNGTTWNLQAYLKAPNAEAFDFFGFAVAISGNTLVVGATGEDGNAVSTLAAPNNGLSSAGAAYVFVRNGTIWNPQAYLKAPNAGVFDEFGLSVSISGNTVVVGTPREDGDASATLGLGNPNNNASDAGAAYVFVRSNGIWSLQAFLKASNAGTNDEFGYAVALVGDLLIVGARRESGDAASTLAAPNERAFAAGAVYVFVRNSGTWSLQAYLKAANADTGDLLGTAVALSDDTIIVGALEEDGDAASTLTASNNNELGAGAVYVFENTLTVTTTTIGTGSGQISLNPPGGVYLSGTVVTATATANPGAVFSGWSGDCSGTDACVLTMTQARSITATFEAVYTVTTTTAGTGSGQISLNPPGGIYPSGTVVTATATANPGAVFSGWSGDCSGTAACVLTMTQSRSITATFTANSRVFLPILIKPAAGAAALLPGPVGERRFLAL